MRSVFEWHLGSRSLQLGKRTLIMGVVNITPDSFSDGGRFQDSERAIEHALRLLEEGADIIDIGGESTRPGARVQPPDVAVSNIGNEKQNEAKRPVTAEEEIERVIPVITALRQKRPNALISIDTYKSTVATVAVAAGAEIVNDVSGFRWDPLMLKTLAALKCGAVLMHMRGRPEEWRNLPPVPDIVMLVKRELRERVDAALMAGVKRERLVLDPGFGFGKNFQENYPLLRHFEEFQQLRYPLLAGVSRKSFLGRALARNGQDAPLDDRTNATMAAETSLILKGVHILRTHDVKASRDAIRIADMVVG